MTDATNTPPGNAPSARKRGLVLLFADPAVPDAAADQLAAATAMAEAAGCDVVEVMFIWGPEWRPRSSRLPHTYRALSAEDLFGSVFAETGAALTDDEVLAWFHQQPRTIDVVSVAVRDDEFELPVELFHFWQADGIQVLRPGYDIELLSKTETAHITANIGAAYDDDLIGDLDDDHEPLLPSGPALASADLDDDHESKLSPSPADASRARRRPWRDRLFDLDLAVGRPLSVARPGSAAPAGDSQPPLPLSGRTDAPLPHDGLYIRRNNAYATKTGPRIAELIEQGVLIDQTQIRFDDFVPIDDTRIPAPLAGEGVAVSHGFVPAPAEVKSDPRTTHLLELAIKTAPGPGENAAAPAPLPANFVFVVDTSSSMAGEKLDHVKRAIQALYDRLRPADVLGIVTFDSQVRTLLPATRKRDLTLARVTSLVGGLTAQYMTDINLGIRYGIEEIRRHGGSEQHVNCLYVFSDGDPTCGEQNWIKIRANVAEQVRGDVTISCFGFGSDARMRELDALAGLTGGRSRFVTHADDVRLDLAEDLTRRDHLAAVNVQVKIQLPDELKVWRFYGHDLITDPAIRAAVEREAEAAGRRARADYGADPLPDLITDEDGLRVFTADLAFGETYWLVFELEAAADSAPDARTPDAGMATVQFLDTTTRANRLVELPLTAPGAIPAEAVLAHTMGLRTSEVVFYGIDDLYQNDLPTAKRRLTDHATVLAAAHAHHPLDQFRDDQVTLRKFLSLADNLGQPIGYGSDARGGMTSMAIMSMNAFGRVRGGHVTSSIFEA